jgi:Flp pilus assembly secretin CpaC
MKYKKYSYPISTLILLVLIFQPLAFAETAAITSIPSADGYELQAEESLSSLSEDPLDWEFEKKEEAAKAKEAKKKAEWVMQPISNEKEIRIVQGNSQVLRFSGTLKRIAASDPDIADVVVIGASEILITTRKKGTTNLIVWDTDDSLYNYHLIVMGDPSTLKAAIDGISTKEDLEVFPTQKGFVVKGNVSTVEEQGKIEAAAKAFSDESVSLVSVQDAKQILLEIRFIEISGSDDFNFGIDGHYIGEKAVLLSLGGATGASLAGDGVVDGALNVARSNFSFPALDGSSASPLIAGGAQDQANRVNYFIKALEARTNARILQDPIFLCAMAKRRAS